MLTLSEVIALPAVRTAKPDVLAAAAQLDRAVRWVHTTELADIGPLLRGGDLVLTTGIALPDGDDALARFASGLAGSDAAGLFVELGRRWTEVPEELVAQCEALGLPLVALRREARFASIAQAVGERLVDDQLIELREAQRVHNAFTELSIAEAGPDQILEAVQQLSGAAVVLESEDHQILGYRDGPDDMSAFLDGWRRRSRRVGLEGRTTWDESNGWLVTRIGRRERGWGRLVIGSPSRPPDRLLTIAERAAAALAVHRLHDRSHDNYVRRLHQELLLGLLADPTDPEIHRRIDVAGLPPAGRRYVGLALRPSRPAGLPHRRVQILDELVASCLHAAEVTRCATLIAAFETDVRVLVAIPSRSEPEAVVERLVHRVRSRTPHVAAAGTAVARLHSADRSLREALHVLTSLPDDADNDRVHGLADAHLRGLLGLLADDDRVRAFAERELAPLSDAGSTVLVSTLRVVLESWDSKSAAATRLNISRPVLYDRLSKLAQILRADLTHPEVRTSLHVALMYLDLPGNHGP